MLRTRKLILAITGALLVSTTTLTAGEFDHALKARQSLMSLYAFNIGPLGAMAKGEMAYDAETAAKSAANLAALSRMGSAAMWPQGSDSDSVEGTRALPALWQNFPDAGAKGAALAEAADALAMAAGTDLDALRAAIGPVGAACGACHKAYRQEE